MNLNHLLSAASVSLILSSPVLQASPLEGLGHIHGLAFTGEAQQTLTLGAHTGLFAYDQQAPRQLSEEPFDVMGMARDPKSGALYASGHPAQGGNTGLLRSDDGGKTFQLVSKGLDGPVDFHQLTVSAADSRVIYGVHGGLHVTRDGGATWVKQGKLPDKLLQLTASAKHADRLYAATEQALLVSDDGGNSWQPLFAQPATSVVVDNGQVYAFVVGEGLIRTDENDMQWREVHNQFGAQVLLDLAISGDGQRLVGLTQYGGLAQSQDGGRTWAALPAKPQPQSELEIKGQQVYQTNCQSCHGLEAVGETYSVEGFTTEGYIFAPALNGSMHAWHHTDAQLVQTVLEGSPRTERMPAWKSTLTEDDAQSVIAYLKTLWGEPQKRCQGPKHMDRACLQGH